jgi:predicted membrane channel-forming protein YqfA (hemolysin III family)
MEIKRTCGYLGNTPTFVQGKTTDLKNRYDEKRRIAFRKIVAITLIIALSVITGAIIAYNRTPSFGIVLYTVVATVCIAFAIKLYKRKNA